jgi:hypothetical protein
MNKTVFIQPESGLQYDWKAIAANPSGHHNPHLDLVAYKALYTNKIAQARACGQEPVLVSLPVMDENRYFAHITRGMTMAERQNVLYWLGGNTARLRNIQAMYNLLLFRLAALQCVHLIDITSPMLAYANYDELLEADGVTLSEAGEAVVGGELTRLSALAC